MLYLSVCGWVGEACCICLSGCGCVCMCGWVRHAVSVCLGVGVCVCLCVCGWVRHAVYRPCGRNCETRATRSISCQVTFTAVARATASNKSANPFLSSHPKKIYIYRYIKDRYSNKIVYDVRFLRDFFFFPVLPNTILWGV